MLKDVQDRARLIVIVPSIILPTLVDLTHSFPKVPPLPPIQSPLGFALSWLCDVRNVTTLLKRNEQD